MDFKDYLNKKKTTSIQLDNPSPSVSNIQEDEEMTQEQFKMLINELQLLRQDINKMNEGVHVHQPSLFTPQQTYTQQLQTTKPVQSLNQPQAAPMQQDSNGFSVGGSPKEIAARAANILS